MSELKSYDVYCVIIKEVDFGLVDFIVKVDAIHICDAAHKVEYLLEHSGIEYCMKEIQEMVR